MSAPLLLAIDQGTTSTRAMLFDDGGTVIAQAQQELRQIYPRDGWVEHDPEDIWRATVAVCRQALDGCDPGSIAGLGITNQRETTLLWERATGRPVYNAVVWQDRRTADRCAELVADGNKATLQAKTGLVIDPYFSATKLAWLLDSVTDARARADRGELAFGTIDSFLLWRLTGGRVHATDATNASRTMLFDIHRQDWDDDLLDLFGVPRSVLPEVRDCAADYGVTDPDLLGAALPVRAMAGDQHAATVGQACFQPGMVKCTYGTGAFAVLNTGDIPLRSRHRLLITLAYRLDGRPTFALEGSIFVAGAAIQWLRDGLGVIDHAAQSENHADALVDTAGVYLVPAFTGLGAPHWDADARGAIVGLTRASGVSQIVRAALESVAYQTHDLIEAMAADFGNAPHELRVDGGMVENGWLMQFLADTLGLPVARPAVNETTALGAAWLAGLQAGVFGSLDEIAQRWREDARFDPGTPAADREHRLAGWRTALNRVLTR